jgi:hypothetical protein
MNEAVDYLGRLGGSKRAPSDGPPRVKTIWIGLMKLYILLAYREYPLMILWVKFSSLVRDTPTPRIPLIIYRRHFETHIQGDPFLKLKMSAVEETDALGFIGRMGNRINKYHKLLAGTRT